jgi:predicted Rossmann fold flavoprotein
MPINKRPSVAIIGGGASGFYTAIQLAELSGNSCEITIIEKTNKLLSKVKISGGGRCNVTNVCDEIPAFAKHYPRGEKFLKKAFYQHNNIDVLNFFKKKGVQIVAEEDGRMFPQSNTSQAIVDTFLDAAVKYNIRIMTSAAVSQIQPTHNGVQLKVNDQILIFDKVVIATGGYPKLGHFDWMLGAIQKEHIVVPLPSLFSFNVKDKNLLSLQGVCFAEVQVKLQGSKLQTRGPLLITHWGISGPAVLRMSAWGALELAAQQYDFTIQINWLTNQHQEEISAQLLGYQHELSARNIVNRNPFGLPQRFWEYVIQLSGIEDTEKWSQLKVKNRNLLAQNLTAMPIIVSGKTTYKDEFVTAGGIDTKAVDVQTMQYKSQPQIYIVGEALNIDGITGGFNFQNAWTTGFIAAKHIAENIFAQ